MRPGVGATPSSEVSIQRNLGALPLDAFVQSLADEIRTRGRETVVTRHFEPATV